MSGVPSTAVEFNGETIGLDEAGRRARDLYAEVRAIEKKTLREARCRLGTLLLAVKRSLPHGSFGTWLEARGIHKHTASSAMALAGEFGGGPGGGLDHGRMERARDEAVAQGRVPADHPLADKPAVDWSLREAEQVAGVRSMPAANRSGHISAAAEISAPADFSFEIDPLAPALPANGPADAAGASGDQLLIVDHMAGIVAELEADAGRLDLASIGDAAADAIDALEGRLRAILDRIERLRAR